jgi:uncharacterized protein YidB (DUF937 family)
MSRDDMLDGLSQQLPGVIDQLTPDGRVPTEQEAARLFDQCRLLAGRKTRAISI